ncbi:hypothetical protein shim_31750 [Shimia sp. SK013]|nr:hypothetical protein shim_31750 [Shimia sp. SK013]
MPRSLAFCVRKIRDNLSYVNRGVLQPGLAQRKVQHLETTYLSHDIDAVFEYGLHDYIQKFLALLAELSGQIETDFRFSE